MYNFNIPFGEFPEPEPQPQVQVQSNQAILSKIDWKLTSIIVMILIAVGLVWWHDQKNDKHHQALKISFKEMEKLIA